MENGSVNGERACKWMLARYELSNIPSAALLDPGKTQANGLWDFLVPPETKWTGRHLQAAFRQSLGIARTLRIIES